MDSKSICRCTLKALIPALALLLVPASVSQSPPLMLDQIPLGSGESTSFAIEVRTNTGPQASPELSDSYTGTTTDNKFTLFVDPASIATKGKYNPFVSFEAWIRANATPPSWSSYLITARTAGTFADSFQDVHFRVNDSGAESNGTINLPVLNPNYQQAIGWTGSGNPLAVKIDLSTDQTPTISFKNTLKGLAVTVTRVDVIKANCPSCWKLLPEDKKNLNIPVAAANGADVPINASPRVTRAVLSTLTALRGDETQDTLRVRLSYKVEPGGAVQSPEFDIPIRFSPTIWSLIVAALIGGAVGTLLDKWKHKEKFSRAYLGRKLLFVIAAELIALFLVVVAKTKLEILTIEMDPRQVLAAAFIALATTGGGAAKSLASDVMATWKKGSDTNATVAGGGDH